MIHQLHPLTGRTIRNPDRRTKNHQNYVTPNHQPWSEALNYPIATTERTYEQQG
jgi:hypothetical protein